MAQVSTPDGRDLGEITHLGLLDYYRRNGYRVSEVAATPVVEQISEVGPAEGDAVAEQLVDASHGGDEQVSSPSSPPRKRTPRKRTAKHT